MVGALGDHDIVTRQVHRTRTLKGNEDLSDGNIDFEHIEVEQVVAGNASIDSCSKYVSGTEAFTVLVGGSVSSL